MAGNFGKFIDRNPEICAAGKVFGDPEETAARCLKDYRLQHQVDALLHDACVFKEPPFKYKLPPLKNYRHNGIYTEARPCFRPKVKTRYQTLINDLKETVYDTYWNKTDKPRDPIPGVPAGMDYENTTFGEPVIRSLPASLAIRPPKTTYEVQWDSQVGHKNYIKSHNDYNPSERKDRQYCQPAFNPNKRFGVTTHVNDPRGVFAPCVCHWYNPNPICTVNAIQSDTVARTHPQVGKVFAPCKNVESAPEGHTFGKRLKRDCYGVAELLKDSNVPPCLFKRQFYEWMSCLNQLRLHVKKRANNFGFCLSDFQDYLLHCDPQLTGWIPLEKFYIVCKCHDLKYDYSMLEPFFRFCGVVENDKINYRDFVFLVDVQKSVPEIIKIEDVPKENQYYVSLAQASNCDFLEIENNKMRPAGIPTIRYDRLYPVVPTGGCRADLESLGDETTAEGVVTPSIYTNYGLTFRDFFMPRTPSILKQIFEKIGYEFPDDTFEKLWKVGLERDKTGGVCVDTFKILVNETISPPKLILKDPCY